MTSPPTEKLGLAELGEEQKQRYSRQIVMPQVGEAGQIKLQQARVLLVGVGGLGSPAALYLAAAGVGTIGLIDSDAVDLSNLGRQIIHSTSMLGTAKVESARASIAELNPEVTVETYLQKADQDTLGPLLSNYDFVLDCTDNLEAKFLINDSCVRQQIPFCHCGVLQFHGQLMTVLPGQTACLRCLFPQQPAEDSVPKPSEAGVAGFVPGIFGALQAAEAIRFFLGAGELVAGRLLSLDALSMVWREIKIPRIADCPVCSAAGPVCSAAG